MTNSAVRKAVQKLMDTALGEQDYDFSNLIAKARRENPIDPETASFFPQRVFINDRAAVDATVIESRPWTV